MSMRGFSVAVCGALALLLAAAQACPAQFVYFPVGRASPLAPGNYNYFPGSYYGPTYSMPSYTYGPNGYSGRPYYNTYRSYSYNTTTPLYYGAASLAPAYSGGSSIARLVSPPPDAAARLADSAAPAAYATAPTYPIQSPTYAPPTRLVSPPLALLTGDAAAKVDVRVAADAEIWFDGQKTSQTGTDRSFTSPSLEAGQNYVYEVRARWNADGKAVDQTRKVAVHAGDRILVNFLEADGSK